MGRYSINRHYIWKYTVKIKYKQIISTLQEYCKNKLRDNGNCQIQVGECCIKLFKKNLWNWEPHTPQVTV